MAGALKSVLGLDQLSTSTMSFTLQATSSFLSSPSPPLFHFRASSRSFSTVSRSSNPLPRLRISASSSSSSSVPVENRRHPIINIVKTCGRAAIFIAATASMVGAFPFLHAKRALAEETQILDEEPQKIENEDHSSPLSDFLGSSSEAVESLKSLLQQKLENGEDQEALKILKGLVSAQPSRTEWKFLMARLLSEMGEVESARAVFEDILAVTPLSFEALFENALLMDRSVGGESAIKRLEEALMIAESENKTKEARDVRMIIAQIHFLQKNVEAALKSYEDLAKEDPDDFRPYFCRGMIYSLLDRNGEAREQFAKYKQLSPKKFDVDGYLRTPLSRMKIFGSDEN